MPDTHQYLDVRQQNKEIVFYADIQRDKWPEGWASKFDLEMEEFLQGNLPHHVQPDWSRAKPGRAKAEIRRWLNKNCQDRWSYTLSGVSFESDRDSILFRLWYG